MSNESFFKMVKKLLGNEEFEICCSNELIIYAVNKVIKHTRDNTIENVK
jgi:translation initiation factor IF-1